MASPSRNIISDLEFHTYNWNDFDQLFFGPLTDLNKLNALKAARLAGTLT